MALDDLGHVFGDLRSRRLCLHDYRPSPVRGDSGMMGPASPGMLDEGRGLGEGTVLGSQPATSRLYPIG